MQSIIQDSKLQKRTRKNPWFDSECRAQFCKIKTADKSEKLCFEKKKNYEYSKELETIIKAQTDRTAFWNIKKSKPQQATVSAVPSYKWIQHFTELFKDVGNPSIRLIKPKEQYLDNLDRPIAPTEITAAVNKMKAGKAAGPDGITIDVIKNAYPILLPALTEIMNRIKESKSLPSSLGKSYIIPLYKGKDPTDPTDYRGLALENVLYKMYCNIENTRLEAW